MKKFLIIQTAFIGDVILATPLIEKLKRFYPDSEIDQVYWKVKMERSMKSHTGIHGCVSMMTITAGIHCHLSVEEKCIWTMAQ